MDTRLVGRRINSLLADLHFRLRPAKGAAAANKSALSAPIRPVNPLLTKALFDYKPVKPEEYVDYCGVEEEIKRDTGKSYSRWLATIDQKISGLRNALAAGDYSIDAFLTDVQNVVTDSDIRRWWAEETPYQQPLSHLLEILCRDKITGPSLQGALLQVISRPGEPQGRLGNSSRFWLVCLKVSAHLRLAGAGEAAAKAIDQLLPHQQDPRLAAAIGAVGQLQYLPSAAALINLLSGPASENYELPLDTIDALGLMRAAAAIEPLVDFFGRLTKIASFTSRFSLARSIMCALDYIGTDQAKERLKQLPWEQLIPPTDLYSARLAAAAAMLADPLRQFDSKNHQWGWLQYDPAISVLIEKLNWLPFVRRTIMSCSGAITDNGRIFSLYHGGEMRVDCPWLNFEYAVSGPFLEEARTFHQQLLSLVIELGEGRQTRGQVRLPKGDFKLSAGGTQEFIYEFPLTSDTDPNQLFAITKEVEEFVDGWLAKYDLAA